jgi:hypothetical protein
MRTDSTFGALLTRNGACIAAVGDARHGGPAYC